VSGLKKYDVEVNGWPTTLQLSDEDAKARGLFEEAPAKKAAPAPKNKARAPRKAKAAVTPEKPGFNWPESKPEG
jgi:hypothetical protein